MSYQCEFLNMLGNSNCIQQMKIKKWFAGFSILTAVFQTILVL